MSKQGKIQIYSKNGISVDKHKIWSKVYRIDKTSQIAFTYILFFFSPVAQIIYC